MSDDKNTEESRNKEIGTKAEKDFAVWLNKYHQPFIYLAQDCESFANIFRKESRPCKRPDYIVLSKNLGQNIFIDVKSRTTCKGIYYFSISKKDVEKLYNFKVEYKAPVYLAFTVPEDADKDTKEMLPEEMNFKFFHFIDVEDVYNLPKFKEEGKDIIYVARTKCSLRFDEVFSKICKNQATSSPKCEAASQQE